MTTTPRFAAKTLLSQSLITGIALSPDGDTLVYSRKTIEKGKYRSRLWRVAVDGGRAEQLTHADAMEGGPAISPDGRSLLFVSNSCRTARTRRSRSHGSCRLTGASRA